MKEGINVLYLFLVEKVQLKENKQSCRDYQVNRAMGFICVAEIQRGRESASKTF